MNDSPPLSREMGEHRRIWEGVFPVLIALVCMGIKRNEYNTTLFSTELYIQLESTGRSVKSFTSFFVKDCHPSTFT